jgi:adenine phosphoribosyltransferase
MSKEGLLIGLTSMSPLKCDAVVRYFGPDTRIVPGYNARAALPEQPMGLEEGIMCCKRRMPEHALTFTVVSIENFLTPTGDMVCVIMQLPTGKILCAVGGATPILEEDYNAFLQSSAMTFGEFIAPHDPKNWMGDRVDKMLRVLRLAGRAPPITAETIGAYLNYTPDWPKEGVLFKDMSPLFTVHHMRSFITSCVNAIPDHTVIDHVVGLESRGFHIGALLAAELDVSFHMARKAGKLPPPTICEEYGTEYSRDQMEMSAWTRFSNGETVLIVDDLIATGGSVSAVARIVKRLSDPSVKIMCFAPLKVDALENVATKQFETESITWIKY